MSPSASLRAALHAAVEALEDSGVPFALFGGAALPVWGRERGTRDADFIVPVTGDDEAERLVEAMRNAGFAHHRRADRRLLGELLVLHFWYPLRDVGLSLRVDLVFSAVESDAARILEEKFAPRVPVVSTSSAFRYEDDVPIIVPGVNCDHAGLIKRQQRERGWKGFVAPIPNCTTTGLVVGLAPLARTFGLRSAIVTSMQALSGAGRSPGVGAMDILDNIVPYIPKEEEKVQNETAKILGTLEGDRIVPLDIPVSATCTRVNVRDGHTLCVTASLGRPARVDEVADAMRAFGREFVDLGLPSTPPEIIRVTDQPDRPQPRIDRGLNDGMTTVVGRIRKDPVLDNGVKWVLLSHNTKLGAAKGALSVAEYLLHTGLI